VGLTHKQRSQVADPVKRPKWVVVADVLDGMKEMFTRTQFAVDQGGYFPEIKVLYPLA
jgi:hypothetical protein